PRRTRPLLACAVLLTATLPRAETAAPPPRAGALPYEGTWRIILPRQRIDITFWLVKFDKAAKKVELVSGVNQYAKTTLGNLKADANGVSFAMAAGPERFTLSALAPRDAKDRVMKGTLMIGGTLSPVWLERTTLTELTQANAVRETPGFPEVQEALALKD